MVLYTFFEVYYKHSEYHVHQNSSLRLGLQTTLAGIAPRSGYPPGMSDEEFLQYVFDVSRSNLNEQLGWGLVCVVYPTGELRKAD